MPRRRHRGGVAALLAAALAACTGDGPPPPQVPLASEPPASYDPLVLDPARVAAGDRFGDLVVASVDVERALDGSVWVGEVVLEGDLVVHGIHQRHPDWPLVEAPCLDVVQPASRARVPRFPSDPAAGPAPRTWFCFENADVALELLGEPDPPREVVVALARYRARSDLADGFDVAEIVEALEVGPAASATLVGR